MCKDPWGRVQVLKPQKRIRNSRYGFPYAGLWTGSMVKSMPGTFGPATIVQAEKRKENAKKICTVLGMESLEAGIAIESMDIPNGGCGDAYYHDARDHLARYGHAWMVRLWKYLRILEPGYRLVPGHSVSDHMRALAGGSHIGLEQEQLNC